MTFFFVEITVVPGQELNEVSISATSAVTATTTSTIQTASTTSAAVAACSSSSATETNVSQATATANITNSEISAPISGAPIPLAGTLISARPGSMVRVPEMSNGRKLLHSFSVDCIYFIRRLFFGFSIKYCFI